MKPALPRRALLAAPLALAALRPARAAPPPYRFRILREGREIGTHQVTFADGQGGTLTTRIAVDIAVRLAGVTVFRMTQRFEEAWAGGRLRAVASRQDRNGTVSEMQARAEGGAVLVQGPEGALRLPPEAAPLTWWDVTRIERQVPLFDNTTGRPLRLAWTRTALPGGGRRWACTGDRESAGEWAADGTWLGWSTKGDDGSAVAYQRVA